MSFIRIWPFDEIDSTADLPTIDAVGWATTFSAIYPDGFSSGKSLILDRSDNYAILSFPNNQAGKTLNLGIYFTPINSGYVLSFGSTRKGLVQQVSLHYDAANEKLSLYRGGSLLATMSGILASGVFNFLQITTLIADAGSFKLYVNGNPTPDIDYTGDTQAQASDDVHSISLGSLNGASGGTTAAYFFAPMLFNTDGSDNNGKVPPNYKYAILHPDSDGASIWTPSTGVTANPLIDEPQGAWNDSDHVSANTMSARNICGVPSIGEAVDGIIGVQLHSRLSRVNTGTVGVKTGVKVATDEQLSDEKFLPSQANNHVDAWEYKAGTTKFTGSDIDIIELVTDLTTAG
jgi:hypothetical protein